MNQEFTLEIVDHSTGQVIGSDKGTAYYLSTQLQDILEHLKPNQGITITSQD